MEKRSLKELYAKALFEGNIPRDRVPKEFIDDVDYLVEKREKEIIEGGE